MQYESYLHFEQLITGLGSRPLRTLSDVHYYVTHATVLDEEDRALLPPSAGLSVMLFESVCVSCESLVLI